MKYYILLIIIASFGIIGCSSKDKGDIAYVDVHNRKRIQIRHSQKEYCISGYKSLDDTSVYFFDKLTVKETLKVDGVNWLIAVLVRKMNGERTAYHWEVWEQAVYDEYLSREGGQEEIPISINKNDDVVLSDIEVGLSNRISELEKQIAILQGEAK